MPQNNQTAADTTRRALTAGAPGAAAILAGATPAAAQPEPFKIAVVSLAHAHVWLHLGTMLAGGHVRLVGLADNAPDRVAAPNAARRFLRAPGPGRACPRR